jgi:hypothetical protein
VTARPPLLLPVIPDKVRLHPLTAALLTAAAFLDLADDELLPPEVAQPILQRVGLYVQRLSDDAADRLADDLERLAKYAVQAGWPDEAREFVEQFMANCGFVVDTDEDAESEDSESDDSDSDEDDDEAVESDDGESDDSDSDEDEDDDEAVESDDEDQETNPPPAPKGPRR